MYKIVKMLNVVKHSNCVVVIGNKHANAYANKRYNLDLKLSPDALGSTWVVDNPKENVTFQVFIALADDQTEEELYDSLLHELIHAIDRLFETYGFDDTELRAYMLTYLNKEFKQLIVEYLK